MDLDAAFVEHSPDVVESHSLRPMTMDVESRRWTGNEDDFRPFREMVSSVDVEADRLGGDWAPFLVGPSLIEEWSQCGTEHNSTVKRWSQTTETCDIRHLGKEYERRRASFLKHNKLP